MVFYLCTNYDYNIIIKLIRNIVNVVYFISYSALKSKEYLTGKAETNDGLTIIHTSLHEYYQGNYDGTLFAWSIMKYSLIPLVI